VASFNVEAVQPKKLIEKAFFYRDLFNFKDPFLKAPILSNRIISQSFKSSCSNLNRIILPFYIEKKNGSGILTFNLYQNNKEQKLVFSTAIHLKDFPPPKKIGTYDVEGVLYYIWIPPQTDSKNRNYIWELTSDKIDEQIKIGLYVNQLPNPRLQPIIIEGIVKDNTYVAFYSYCQYRFEWRKILNNSWHRIKREKIFIISYLVLMVGIVLAIRLKI
tara:strand:+ start:2074 stop:2724 length:651 start_codon:yes stop_codon:yes gene_type:complete